MGSIVVEDFDLALTLASGQCFRYHTLGDEYGHFAVITAGHVVSIVQAGDELRYTGADERVVRELLGLTPDHDAAMRRLAQDSALSAIVQRYRCLRVMRLGLHETILAFICSSQSNIPKIRMNLQLLSSSLGAPLAAASDGTQYCALPPPGAALDHAAVLAAKTGYRAKYLVATNARLTPEMLGAIKAADYRQAHALLCELPGVGPKVADCICLFGLGHHEAFPVDVHILRAMRALFPRRRFKDEAAARAFAQARWGRDAGRAQQFIFQWARETLSAKTVARKVRA
jgi:N-glycosylase/DNA lyase